VTITKGIDHPGGIATDATGDLFVNSLNNQTIVVFTKPYGGQSRVLPGKFPFSQLVFDNSENLFVLTNAGNPPSTLLELKPPYDNPVVRIRNILNASSFALDSHDDVLMTVYAPSCCGSMLKLYLAPRYTKVGTTLKFPEGIEGTGVNANDQLFVEVNASVIVYAINGKRLVRLHKPIGTGCGGDLAVPARGNVFTSTLCVPSYTMAMYEITGPAFDHATLLPGLKKYTVSLAVDSGGNLYIAGENDVWISSPPYSGVTDTTPVNYEGQDITAMALGPAQ
jgi:hypothetical protein